MDENAANELPPFQKFVRRYHKSEIIFEEGSTGNEMYLIYSGKVLLSFKGDKPEPVKLAFLNPGEFFGEMALVDDCCRSATASALEDDTQLIVLDRAKFLYMVQQQPSFALSVMHTLCRRLRELDKRLKGESSGGR